MACHHFVFQAFPEVFETVIDIVALELVYIFNLHIIVGAYLDLKAGHSIQHLLVVSDFVLI